MFEDEARVAEARALYALVSGPHPPWGSSAELVELVGACQAAKNVLDAVQVVAMARVAATEDVVLEDGTVVEQPRPIGSTRLDGPSLVAARLGVSEQVAATRMRQAVLLADAGRPVVEAMGQGRVDAYRAGIVAEETAEGDPQVRRAVAAAVADALGNETAGPLRRRVVKELAKLDPDAVRQRAQRAVAERYLRRFTDYLGADRWEAAVPVESARAAWAAIDQVAQGYRDSGRAETIEQARVDAMLDLICGRCTGHYDVELAVPADQVADLLAALTHPHNDDNNDSNTGGGDDDHDDDSRDGDDHGRDDDSRDGTGDDNDTGDGGDGNDTGDGGDGDGEGDRSGPSGSDVDRGAADDDGDGSGDGDRPGRGDDGGSGNDGGFDAMGSNGSDKGGGDTDDRDRPGPSGSADADEGAVDHEHGNDKSGADTDSGDIDDGDRPGPSDSADAEEGAVDHEHGNDKGGDEDGNIVGEGARSGSSGTPSGDVDEGGVGHRDDGPGRGGGEERLAGGGGVGAAVTVRGGGGLVRAAGVGATGCTYVRAGWVGDLIAGRGGRLAAVWVWVLGCDPRTGARIQIPVRVGEHRADLPTSPPRGPGSPSPPCPPPRPPRPPCPPARPPSRSGPSAGGTSARPPTRSLGGAGYRPSAALTRLVRLRDGQCRFPGCTVAARFCDLDHVRPWPTGPTRADNLVCLCRRHHRIKQRHGWHARLLPDGTLQITDPTGAVRTSNPVDLLDLTASHPLPREECIHPTTAGTEDHQAVLGVHDASDGESARQDRDTGDHRRRTSCDPQRQTPLVIFVRHPDDPGDDDDDLGQGADPWLRQADTKRTSDLPDVDRQALAQPDVDRPVLDLPDLPINWPDPGTPRHGSCWLDAEGVLFWRAPRVDHTHAHSDDEPHSAAEEHLRHVLAHAVHAHTRRWRHYDDAHAARLAEHKAQRWAQPPPF